MLHLIACYLLRAPLRSLLAIVSFAAAFALFVLLIGIATAFSTGIAGEPFLHVSKARNYNVDFMPPTAVADVAATPGVESLTPLYNLPVYYGEPTGYFIAVGVSPAEFLAMFDVRLSEPARRCFLERRTGALATAELAARFGWEAGSQIPLISSHDLTRQGDKNWPFELCGLFSPPPEMPVKFLANFDFVDQYHIAPVRKYGQFIVKVADPAAIGKTAAAIDALFEHERYATASIPLDQYQRRRARLLGDDFARTVTLTLGAVFFALTLSTICATGQSVRERTAQFGVLRTVGFKASSTLMLVALETCLLAVAGAAAGMAAVFAFEGRIAAAMQETVGRFEISPAAAVLGLALAALLGMIAAAASTLRILRRPVAALLA